MSNRLHTLNLLFDFYGELLTEKQRVCFEMHYMEDLSLTEIGDQYGVTPQAVADLLKRTVVLLEKYEEKLGLVDKHVEQRPTAGLINKALDEITRADNRERVESIKRLVGSLLV